MEDYLFNNRWLKSVCDEPLRRIFPTDQVDALPTQGIDDILDAEAPEADAGTDAINRRVVALKGKLAAIPGLARDSLDLHLTVRSYSRVVFGIRA